jgi:hypothetical protein
MKTKRSLDPFKLRRSDRLRKIRKLCLMNCGKKIILKKQNN